MYGRLALARWLTAVPPISATPSDPRNVHGHANAFHGLSRSRNIVFPIASQGQRSVAGPAIAVAVHRIASRTPRDQGQGRSPRRHGE